MLTITRNDIFTTQNKTSDKCHLANWLVMVSHLSGVSFYMAKKTINPDNYIGLKFGKLTIVEFSHFNKYSKSIWVCECECGKRIVVGYSRLTSGEVFECINQRNKSPRVSSHPLYYTWRGIIQRCYDKKNTPYKYYGGRGIAVCDRWRYSFSNFLSDMGEKPSNLHSIERIDNNGDYTPTNCKWATRREQSNNKSNIIKIEYMGELKTTMELSEILNIDRKKVYRLYRKNKHIFSSKK